MNLGRCLLDAGVVSCGGSRLGLGAARVLHGPRRVRRGAGADAAPDRRAVLPRQAAARHRQRPDHRQRLDHAGRRRDHAPDRPGPRRRAASRSSNAVVEIWQVDGKGVYLHSRDSGRPQARHELPGLRPLHHRLDAASTTSAPSSRCRTPAARRTSTSRSRRAAGNCSPRRSSSTAIRRTRRDGVFRGVRDPFDRELVLVDFKPIKDSKIGELSAQLRHRGRPAPPRIAAEDRRR